MILKWEAQADELLQIAGALRPLLAALTWMRTGIRSVRIRQHYFFGASTATDSETRIFPMSLPLTTRMFVRTNFLVLAL